jgi:hypothetical protein
MTNLTRREFLLLLGLAGLLVTAGLIINFVINFAQDAIKHNEEIRISNNTMKSFDTDVLPITQKTVKINGELHIFLNPKAGRTGPSCGDISTDPSSERMRVDCEKHMFDQEGKICPVDVCTMNLPHGNATADLCTIYLDNAHCPGGNSEYASGPSGCAYTIQYDGLMDCIGMPHPPIDSNMSFVITFANGTITNMTAHELGLDKPIDISDPYVQGHNGTIDGNMFVNGSMEEID